MALLVAFSGSVSALIPLYTVGVFIAFTLSQAGMVRHWLRLRADEPRWRRLALVNGIGALTTGIVAVEVGATKFALGAWIVLILIPIQIAADAVHQRPVPRLGDQARRATRRRDPAAAPASSGSSSR